MNFLFGGSTGLVLSNTYVDAYFHDSYFVVGHFHYVLSLSILYGILAATFTYLPTLYSSQYFNELFGLVHSFVLHGSTAFIFLPMHVMGFFMIPRRAFSISMDFFGLSWMTNIGFVGIIMYVIAIISLI